MDWFEMMVPEMRYMNVCYCLLNGCKDVRVFRSFLLRVQVLSASLTPLKVDEKVAFEIDLDELSASLPNRP